LETSMKNVQGMIQPKGFPGLPSDWRMETDTFSGIGDEVQLFAINFHCQPVNSHRALLILHGQGEHGGRYLHLPHYLKDWVDTVYCFDHRGHGRSEGLRGHVEHFDVYTDEALIALRRLDEKLKSQFGKSEIHLLGHSMGGLVALRLLLKNSGLPLASATISAPLLGVRFQVPVIKKYSAYALARVWGSLQMDSGLDPKLISRDEAVQDAYLADRLVHSKVTPKFFTELEAAMADTLSCKSGIHVPLQFIVPLKDQIVDSDLALEFYENLNHPDKRLKSYPEFHHEPFNEIEKEKAIEDLCSWIKIHSSSGLNS